MSYIFITATIGQWCSDGAKTVNIFIFALNKKECVELSSGKHIALALHHHLITEGEKGCTSTIIFRWCRMTLHTYNV